MGDDVLTKKEREFAEKLRSHVSITGRVHGKSAAALAIVDRLVAEVERKNDYATRMDALAEERLIEINRLKAGERLYDSAARIIEELKARNEKLVAAAKVAVDGQTPDALALSVYESAVAAAAILECDARREFLVKRPTDTDGGEAWAALREAASAYDELRNWGKP